MKVLLAATGSPPPTFVRRRALALAGKGLQIMVASRNPGVWEPKGKIQIFREAPFPKAGGPRLLAGLALRPAFGIRLLRAGGGQMPLRSWLAFLARHPYILTLPKPDLVHVQWIASALQWKLVAQAWEVPLLASVRGSQVTVNLHRDQEYQRHIRRCLQAADAVHCVSESLAQRCRALGCGESKLFVNYNGVDLKAFYPAVSRDQNEPLKVVTVGALVPRKNLSHALLVMARCGLPAHRLVLQIVGEGPEEIYLRHGAERLGLGSQVQFLGALEDRDVALLLRQADVYLSTSMAEGLANSVVEAAASGLPILAYECEGMREVVEEGKNGFLAPFGDVDGLAQALRLLARDNGRRRSMGFQSRRLAEERFPEDRCVEEMLGWYRDLIRKENGRG